MIRKKKLSDALKHETTKNQLQDMLPLVYKDIFHNVDCFHIHTEVNGTIHVDIIGENVQRLGEKFLCVNGFEKTMVGYNEWSPKDGICKIYQIKHEDGSKDLYIEGDSTYIRVKIYKEGGGCTYEKWGEPIPEDAIELKIGQNP